MLKKHLKKNSRTIRPLKTPEKGSTLTKKGSEYNNSFVGGIIGVHFHNGVQILLMSECSFV